jgi:hypothetical protein
MKRPMYLSFQRGLCFRARPRGHKCLWTLLVDAGFGDLPSMAGVVGLVGPIKLTEMGHLQKVGLLGPHSVVGHVRGPDPSTLENCARRIPRILGNSEGISQNNLKGVVTKPSPRKP